MRISRWLVSMVCVVGLPVAAAAQAPTTQTTTANDYPLESHWLASGFVGSDFGIDTNDSSVNFGGTIGYLWRGTIGGEFLANFSPNVEFDGDRNALLFGDQPWINSYMANAMGALPLMANGQFQPYVSGGLGVLTLRSEPLDFETNEIEPDDHHWGSNIGAGLMGFLGNMGVRFDVRYFRGFDENTADEDPANTAEFIGSQVLDRLAFWRANAGVALRW